MKIILLIVILTSFSLNIHATFGSNAEYMPRNCNCPHDQPDCNQVNYLYMDHDKDNDGLEDLEEIRDHRTDRYNPDTDGDGISDGDEVANGTDPLVSDLVKEQEELTGTGANSQPYHKWLYFILVLSLIALVLCLKVYIYEEGVKANKNS